MQSILRGLLSLFPILRKKEVDIVAELVKVCVPLEIEFEWKVLGADSAQYKSFI